MQDQPTAAELVEAVAAFIRERVMPELSGHTAFHARVAANALDIVKRELEIAPSENGRELARLVSLLGHEGKLDELNRELCLSIRQGEMTLDTPGLAEHLWRTALTKLSIDQPAYSGYRQALAEEERQS